ncbi:MAG TPA: ABC transporter permease [Gemmataceae bacterium]|nr:ABC transporter permease [Gemmataceae bacterium]
MTDTPSPAGPPPPRVPGDVPFLLLLAIIGGLYVVLIVAMLAADVSFLVRQARPTPPGWAESLWEHFARTLASPAIRYAIRLSLISCTLTAILSVWVAVPLGYLLSRYHFRGKWLLDALLDIPIVLPPLVIGLSLLILFHVPLGGKSLELYLQENLHFSVTYTIPSVVLAQFAVACAFAVRTMRVTFDGLSPRHEQVALTLGCTRAQAFWWVVLPSARRGMVTAATLAWARALGEFGPILVFSGATRLRTEVLPTTVFLELSVGNLEAAVAVSLLMVLAAVIVLVVVRVYGMDAPAMKAR